MKFGLERTNGPFRLAGLLVAVLWSNPLGAGVLPIASDPENHYFAVAFDPSHSQKVDRIFRSVASTEFLRDFSFVLEKVEERCVELGFDVEADDYFAQALKVENTPAVRKACFWPQLMRRVAQTGSNLASQTHTPDNMYLTLRAALFRPSMNAVVGQRSTTPPVTFVQHLRDIRVLLSLWPQVIDLIGDDFPDENLTPVMSAWMISLTPWSFYFNLFLNLDCEVGRSGSCSETKTYLKISLAQAAVEIDSAISEYSQLETRLDDGDTLRVAFGVHVNELRLLNDLSTELVGIGSTMGLLSPINPGFESRDPTYFTLMSLYGPTDWTPVVNPEELPFQNDRCALMQRTLEMSPILNIPRKFRYPQQGAYCPDLIQRISENSLAFEFLIVFSNRMFAALQRSLRQVPREDVERIEDFQTLYDVIRVHSRLQELRSVWGADVGHRTALSEFLVETFSKRFGQRDFLLEALDVN